MRSNLLLFLMIRKSLPFAIVNDAFFRALTCTQMDRHNVSGRVKEIRDAVKKKIMELLAVCPWISACFDEWQSASRQSYLAINVQASDGCTTFQFCLGHIHITQRSANAATLGGLIKERLAKFGVWDRVAFFVTDNASVCKKAVSDLARNRLSCSAHVFNLMLGDFVAAYKKDLQPLFSLAAKSRHSSMFRKICEDMAQRDGRAVRRTSLVTFSSTRFYSMIELLTACRDLKEEVHEFAKQLRGSKTTQEKDGQEAVPAMIDDAIMPTEETGPMEMPAMLAGTFVQPEMDVFGAPSQTELELPHTDDRQDLAFLDEVTMDTAIEGDS
jgi:hypothetical protein